MVGLRTGILLFNTPYSFSLYFSSKTLAICFESAILSGGIVRFSDNSSLYWKSTCPMRQVEEPTCHKCGKIGLPIFYLNAIIITIQ